MDTASLLNKAAMAVSTLGKGKSTQVNKLLDVLSTKEGKDGILRVQEHLVYQSAGGRNLLSSDFCRRVYEDLRNIMRSKDTSESEIAKLAQRYLTHIKRLYKGAEGRNVNISDEGNAFDELASQVLKKAAGNR